MFLKCNKSECEREVNSTINMKFKKTGHLASYTEGALEDV